MNMCAEIASHLRDCGGGKKFKAYINALQRKTPSLLFMVLSHMGVHVGHDGQIVHDRRCHAHVRRHFVLRGRRGNSQGKPRGRAPGHHPDKVFTSTVAAAERSKTPEVILLAGQRLCTA